MQHYDVIATSFEACVPYIHSSNVVNRENALATVVIKTGVGGWKAYQATINHNRIDDPVMIQLIAAHGAKMDRESAVKMFPTFDKDTYDT